MQDELLYEYKNIHQLIVTSIVEVIVIILLMAFFKIVMMIDSLLILGIILIALISFGIFILKNVYNGSKGRGLYIICNKDGIYSEQYLNRIIRWKEIKGFEMVKIDKYLSIGILTDSYDASTYEIDGKRYFLIPVADSKEKPRHIIEELEMYKFKMDNRKVKLKK